MSFSRASYASEGAILAPRPLPLLGSVVGSRLAERCAGHGVEVVPRQDVPHTLLVFLAGGRPVARDG